MTLDGVLTVMYCSNITLQELPLRCPFWLEAKEMDVGSIEVDLGNGP